MSEFTTDHDLQSYENLSCGHECHNTDKYGFVPEAGCPVHDKPLSIKTWQEEFDEKFVDRDGDVSSYPHKVDSGDNEDYYFKAEEIKQFISDLRKRDMEAMLKITDDYYDGEGIEDWNKRLQLIKDHYEN